MELTEIEIPELLEQKTNEEIAQLFASTLYTTQWERKLKGSRAKKVKGVWFSLSLIQLGTFGLFFIERAKGGRPELNWEIARKSNLDDLDFEHGIEKLPRNMGFLWWGEVEEIEVNNKKAFQAPQMDSPIIEGFTIGGMESKGGITNRNKLNSDKAKYIGLKFREPIGLEIVQKLRLANEKKQ